MVEDSNGTTRGARNGRELTSSSKGTIPPLPMPVCDACTGNDGFFSGKTLRAAFWMVSNRGIAMGGCGLWRDEGKRRVGRRWTRVVKWSYGGRSPSLEVRDVAVVKI